MNKYILLALLMFSAIYSNAQTFTDETIDFFGAVTFSGATTGGTADAQVTLTPFIDETGHGYNVGQIQAGDILWDRSLNIWEVAVVNSSSFFSANVDLWRVKGTAGTPVIAGALARRFGTAELLNVPTHSSVSITPKMLAEIQSYNTKKIQLALEALQGVTVSDSLWYALDTLNHRNVDGEIQKVKISLSDKDSIYYSHAGITTLKERLDTIFDKDLDSLYFSINGGVELKQRGDTVFVTDADSIYYSYKGQTILKERLDTIFDIDLDSVYHSVLGQTKLITRLDTIFGIEFSDSSWVNIAEDSLWLRDVDGDVVAVSLFDKDSIKQILWQDSTLKIVNINDDTVSASIPFQQLLTDSDVVRFADTVTIVATKADIDELVAFSDTTLLIATKSDIAVLNQALIDSTDAIKLLLVKDFRQVGNDHILELEDGQTFTLTDSLGFDSILIAGISGQVALTNQSRLDVITQTSGIITTSVVGNVMFINFTDGGANGEVNYWNGTSWKRDSLDASMIKYTNADNPTITNTAAALDTVLARVNPIIGVSRVELGTVDSIYIETLNGTKYGFTDTSVVQSSGLANFYYGVDPLDSDKTIVATGEDNHTIFGDNTPDGNLDTFDVTHLHPLQDKVSVVSGLVLVDSFSTTDANIAVIKGQIETYVNGQPLIEVGDYVTVAGWAVEVLTTAPASVVQIVEKPIQDINNTYTTGSLLFAGSNGQVEEINSQLFYDSTGKHLGIRTDNPTAAALEIYGLSGTGDFPLLMRGDDRGAGNGTDYLTYFDNSIPALYTNGYITINGENTGGDFVQQNIVGISNYMLGIKSDVGANPTVLISTSTGRLIDGRDGAGNEIWNVDALGNVQVGSSANSYINIGSNVASQALLELKNGSFFSYYGGEAFPRLEMSRNQGLRLGDGLTTPDVRLYRSAANTLRTPDNLIVDGTISGTIATGFVTGSVVIQGGSTIAETSSLFFDNSNKRLGIGTNTPSATMHSETDNFSTLRMATRLAPADEKIWEWQTGNTVGGGLLRLRAIGDGVTPSNNALIINRTGTTIDNFSMQGDIYANQVGKGFVTKSADGNCWRITVDNAGVLTTTAIACP